MRTTIVARNGGRCICYPVKSLHSPSNIQDERPMIVDAPLTLIVRTSAKSGIGLRKWTP